MAHLGTCHVIIDPDEKPCGGLSPRWSILQL
jgi:hypothetical protein